MERRSLSNTYMTETLERPGVSQGRAELNEKVIRIIVVEDEKEVRELCARILAREGFEVISASNGADALRVLENETEPIDLLLTDVVMPEMDGPELARHLRLKCSDLKVLFMSGYTTNTSLAQESDKDTTFLQKPFPPRDLVSKVQEILRS